MRLEPDNKDAQRYLNQIRDQMRTRDEGRSQEEPYDRVRKAKIGNDFELVRKP